MLSDRVRPDVEAAPWVIDEIKKLEAEVARLTEAHDWQHRMAGERLRRVEILEHNVRVLTDALWKSCGDDEETVSATVESQGVLK